MLLLRCYLRIQDGNSEEAQYAAVGLISSTKHILRSRFFTLYSGVGSLHDSRVQVYYTTPGFRFFTLLQGSGSVHYSRIQVLYTTPGFRF